MFSPPPVTYVDNGKYIRIPVENGEVIYTRYYVNPRAEFTILYCHGNNEDIGSNIKQMQRFRKKGFSVLTFDYRGYGLSAGKSSVENTYRDSRAVYDYLVNQLAVDPAKIIVMGRSLGGGVAVELASDKPVGGLILQSTFVTINRVLTGNMLRMPFEKYNNIRKITEVNCPVLVIHGKDDKLVRIWHGKKLFAAANEPKFYLWVDGTDHEDDIAAIAPDGYWTAFKKLADAVKRQPYTR